MRLYLLNLGTIHPIAAPVPGYLIQLDDGTNVLIDTGPSRFESERPQMPPGWSMEVGPEDFIVDRLEGVGVKPADIDVLVCTHFDDDHAGNHDLFTSAEFVVQRSHYELARAGHPRSAGVRKRWDDPALKYRFVDGDTTLLPSVKLIETSGHVPGHQSVLVQLPNTGPVLLAIDAVPLAAWMDADTRVIHPNDLDEATTRASTRKLAGLAQRERVKLIIHGHDAEQWQMLKRPPGFYD